MHTPDFIPLQLRRLVAHRALKIALAALLVLAVLSWLGLPPLARWGVEKYGSQALGRPLTVGSVSFNPLLLSLRLEDLRLAEADGQGDFVSLAALQLNVSTASLLHRALVLDALRVEQPRIKLQRLDEHRFNFSDILERFAKPADEPDSGTGLPRFSLNNIELSAGEILFEDRLLGEQHQFSKLALGLPFVSNLPARVESFVQPNLAFELDGSPFELLGEVKLFADHREATLNLDIDDLDLTRYLAYLPRKLPVRIEQARLNSSLQLKWEEAVADKPASVALSGQFGLADLLVKDAAGAELFALQRVQVDLTRLEPLAKPALLHVQTLQIDAPRLELLREKDQRFRLQRLLDEFRGPSAPPKVVKSAQAPAPRVRVDKIRLAKGRVHWRDEVPPGGYALDIEPVDIQLDGFELGGQQATKLTLKAAGGETLRIELQAALALAAETYSGQFSFSGVQLDSLRPYYTAALPRALFTGETALAGQFSVAPGKKGPAVKLDKMLLNLKNFSLADASAKPGKQAALVRVPQTKIEGIRVDLEKRELHVAHFSNRGLQALLQRDAAGVLNVQDLFESRSRADSKAKVVLKNKLEHVAEVVLEAAPAANAEQPWQLSVDKVDLSEGDLRLEDRSGSVPVVLDIHELGMGLQDWSLRRHAKSRATISARVNRNGRVSAESSFSTVPLLGKVKLDVRALDLLPVQPYLDELYRVLLTRGTLTAKGQLDFDLSRMEQPDIRFVGALSVDDFNMLDRVNDEDFLRWKRLSLQDMSVQTAPLGFSSKEVRLSEFYTRLILDAQGRLNLREIAAHEEVAAAPAPAQSAPPAAVGKALPKVSVDNIVLEKGHVRFSDRFVKPNYDANLLALNGGLGGLSSDEKSVATLDLGASLDGAAPVKVYGSLNPFRQDGFLDIQAQVRDVDLTSASTYAARYVGYGIDRGKFSMDVQYTIRDRQLSASNSLRLDQLSFGSKVDSPDATSLPVLFAVSLLKDRHGVINVNLPISGSLDDPKFSVGSVILKVIANLIGKAVTAPFALLGSVFGDSTETMAFVDFSPGSTALSAAARQKLDGLARALADRPALKLEIAGRVEPAGDTTGLKRARLDGRLRALKAEQMVKRGESVVQVDSLIIDPAEYPALLTRLYESEKLESRPRNALGLLKSLPPVEMEKILLAAITISVPELEILAAQRGQLVRGYLLDQGKVEPVRVFLRGTAGVAETSAEMPARAQVVFSLR